MPYMHISTSARLDADQIDSLRRAVYELIPLLPGKSREVTMIHIDGDQILHLNEEDVPAAFVDLRISGAAPLKDKQAFVKAFSEALTRIAGVDAGHSYFNILELNEWGAHGGYFAR